jgi:hypothetical protein
MTLSDDQFEGLAQRVNSGSGFSIRTHGPKAGQEASNSFMVGNLSQGAKASTPTSGAELKGFAESRSGELSRTDRFMGAWGNDLDVSRSFPLTKRGEVGARSMTIAQGQKAAGKIGASPDDYLGDVTPPMAKERGRGNQVPYPSVANKRWVYEPIRTRRPRA